MSCSVCVPRHLWLQLRQLDCKQRGKAIALVSRIQLAAAQETLHMPHSVLDNHSHADGDTDTDTVGRRCHAKKHWPSLERIGTFS